MSERSAVHRSWTSDEIWIHLAPILLGEGTRLFEHIGGEQIELESTGGMEFPWAMHLSFRIVK